MHIPKNFYSDIEEVINTYNFLSVIKTKSKLPTYPASARYTELLTNKSFYIAF